MSSSDDHAAVTSSFCDLTGASTEQVSAQRICGYNKCLLCSFCTNKLRRVQAEQYLTASGWDLENAVPAFFADQEEDAAGPSEPASRPAAAAEYTGPRTLDGRPAPQYASAPSSSAPKRPPKKKGVATLSSMGGGHDDHDDSEEDDDEDEAGRPRDLFAGGEKSGLAVQDPPQRSSDPMKLINDILAKAKAYVLHVRL